MGLPRLGIGFVLALCIIPSTAESTRVRNEETFHEELLLRPLEDGRVYAHFQFTTRRLHRDSVHHNVFPKTVSEMVQQSKVNELNVALTQGRWQYKSWGYPVVSAPTGGEVWAWFDKSVDDVDRCWNGVTSALSGLLCASFNFVDAANTAKPCLLMQPHRRAARRPTLEACSRGNSTLRYSSLPRENVCTENLTPWAKLLPCRSNGGLASLLSGLKMFNSAYSSLALTVRPYCLNSDCTDAGQELVLTASVVFDKPQGPSYNLHTLFGRESVSACAVATSSHVHVAQNLPSTLNPPTPKFTSQEGGPTYATYDLLGENATLELFTLEVTPTQPPKRAEDRQPPAFYMNRHLSGYGQENGGVDVDLHNTLAEPLSVAYLEAIPWFVRVYGHTVAAYVHGNRTDDVIQYSRFVPSIDRERPMTLEVVMTLPPHSHIQLRFDFDRAFIRLSEHRPDANRGFDVSAGVAEVRLLRKHNPYGGLDWSPILYTKSARDTYVSTRVHTSVGLVAMPLPDFSMPYNVITLTGTLMALSFGFFFNLSTRRFVMRTEPRQAPIVKLFNRLLGRKQKPQPSTDTPTEPEGPKTKREEVAKLAPSVENVDGKGAQRSE